MRLIWIFLCIIIMKIVCLSNCYCDSGDYVVLLHGIARKSSSMDKIETYLHTKGYNVINYDYESRKYNIKELSLQLKNMLSDKCKDKTKKINFVTHSLGGIVVRTYLEDNKLDNIGKIVMLTPPNKGSEVVNYLKHIFIFKWIYGPAGLELGTDNNSVPLKLNGAGKYDIGVIAGDFSWNRLFSLFLPGKDDGSVSVESTKLSGMKDHIIFHYTHSFIMNKMDVIKQVAYFLRTGMFNK